MFIGEVIQLARSTTVTRRNKHATSQFFHFKEKGTPLRSFTQTRSLALRDSIAQDVEPLKGRPALVPSITAILRVPREPLEPLGK